MRGVAGLGGLLGAAALASALSDAGGGFAEENENEERLKGKALIDFLKEGADRFGDLNFKVGDIVTFRDHTVFKNIGPMIVVEAALHDLRSPNSPIPESVADDVFDVRVLRPLGSCVIADIFPGWSLRAMTEDELDAYQGLPTKAPAASVGDEEEARSADSPVPTDGPLDDIH